MFPLKITKIRTVAVAGSLAALAACATPPPPPPPSPPPPPPAPVVIPARPLPPTGAALSMTVPPVGPDGIRQTVNANLTPAQAIWNVRSALNVAALNCLKPQHVAILPNYTAFLKTHAKELKATNTQVGREFRENHGSSYLSVQDVYMTQVYNYFALPPAQSDFCDAALAVSQDAATSPTGSLEAFAARGLPRLEVVFDDFYRRFEQYRYDVALWDAQYGTPVYATPTYSEPTYAGSPANTYLSAPYTAPEKTSVPASTGPAMVSIPVVESTSESAVVPSAEPAPQPTFTDYGPVVQPLPGAAAPVLVDSVDNAASPVPEPYVPPVSGPVVQPLPEGDGQN